MRIALVLDLWDPGRGGLESWAARWAAWLAGRGHDVHAVCRETPVRTTGDLTLHPAGRPRPVSPLRAAEQLSEIARGIGADLVHDLGAGLGGDVFHPFLGARRTGSKARLAALDPLRRLLCLASPRRIVREAAIERLERLQARGPGRLVIASSRRVASDLVRLAGADPDRLRVVPNPPDLRVRPADGSREEVRAANGWGRETTVFLQIARDPALDGLATSLRAVRLLRRRGFEVHLAVAGRFPAGDRFRFLAERLGIAERVSLLGPVEDPGPLLGAVDALVQPAFHDACSLACVDALAAGLPVAVSVRDGASELVTDGVQGWLIRNPADPHEVAFQMKRLLDPGLRGALGAQAAVLAGLHGEPETFGALERLLLDELEHR